MSWKRKRTQFVKRNYSIRMKCIMVLWRISFLDWRVNRTEEPMLFDEAKGDELIAIVFPELWMNWNFSFLVFIFVYFLMIYFVNMILLTHFCTFLEVFVWNLSLSFSFTFCKYIHNFQNYSTIISITLSQYHTHTKYFALRS